jgi:hypothetical protein
MKSHRILALLLSFLIFPAFQYLLVAQENKKALDYLNIFSIQYKKMEKEAWDYTSSFAHGRNARKIERERQNLARTIETASGTLRRMPGFENDPSLRDSVISFLEIYSKVINGDYAQIVNLEEVAEQSYDAMEAYLLASERAGQKLDIASKNASLQFSIFAKKNNINLVEDKDELSRKLNASSIAINYYNKLYLVFYKPYKQEAYLFDAFSKEDINSIEQNRNSLIDLSKESLAKLLQIGSLKGDNSLNAACKRALTFYKDEAESKIPAITDFLLVKKDYIEMMALYKSKDRMFMSDEETKKYNKSIDLYNKSLTKYNSATRIMNQGRSSVISAWNNSIDNFMNIHVPKK